MDTLKWPIEVINGRYVAVFTPRTVAMAHEITKRLLLEQLARVQGLLSISEIRGLIPGAEPSRIERYGAG